MTYRRRARALVALLSVVLVAAACGDDDGTVVADRGAPPGDGSEMVIQVTAYGGFLPVETALSTTPMITVLADGTVITPAPVPAIYPGPAIQPLQAGTISAADIDALIERARSTGLLDGPLELGSPPVTDQPTTRVTIRADGRTVQHEAYALQEDTGVDPAEAQNRERLRGFIDQLSELSVGDRPWTPTAVVATIVGPYVADPTVGPHPPVDWPLATAPDTDGELPCTVIEGADAETLMDALAGANQLTPWVIDGEQYSMAFRPLVPGDRGCE